MDEIGHHGWVDQKCGCKLWMTPTISNPKFSHLEEDRSYKTKCIYGWPFTIHNSKLSRSEEHGSHQPSFSCCRAHKTKYNVICTVLKIFRSIDSKEIIGKLQEEIVKPVKNCM